MKAAGDKFEDCSVQVLPRSGTFAKCKVGGSSKNPIFLKLSGLNPEYWAMKTCARCAFQDWFSMKLAQWFKTEVLSKIASFNVDSVYDGPIIQEYGVIPIRDDQGNYYSYLTEWVDHKHWYIHDLTFTL